MYVQKRLRSGEQSAESSHLNYDIYRIKHYHYFSRNETIKRMIRRAHKIIEENENYKNL